MAFGYQERKPLLYADLFNPHKKTALETEQQQVNTFFSQLETGSSSGSSSNLFNSSFCDSSSSGFSTPFESELGSSESEDADFMSELTRQMAECMLEEDEETGETAENDDNPILDSVSEDSEGIISPVKNYNELGYVDSAAINNLKYTGLYPGPVPANDETQSVQVYQLKNQPLVSENSAGSRVGRLNGTELAQLILHKTEQPYMQYRVRHWGIGKGGKGKTGSGMQAVFLGGSGRKNVSGGTGVFLPRVTNDPSELKKKQGCSTVLIPTRVLQTLEQHFNGRPSSAAPPLNGRRGSHNRCYSKVEWTRSSGQELKHQPTTHEDQEILLPQEWTY